MQDGGGDRALSGEVERGGGSNGLAVDHQVGGGIHARLLQQVVVDSNGVGVHVEFAGFAGRLAVSRVVVRSNVDAQPCRELQKEEEHLAAVHGICVRPEHRLCRALASEVEEWDRLSLFGLQERNLDRNRVVTASLDEQLIRILHVSIGK